MWIVLHRTWFGDEAATSCRCAEASAISSSNRAHRFGVSDLRDPWAWLALGGGSGLAPVAPGTAGSLLALALWWLLLADLPWPLQDIVALLAFGIGWLALNRLARRLSSDDEPLADEPAFVIDEIVGCWVALASVPKSWPWIIAAFALFRLADIIKPWPISWADRVFAAAKQPRKALWALGIMLDDLIAGILVAALLIAAQTLLATSG